MTNVKEKFSRLTWNLFQGVKDTLISNISNAAKESKIKISQEELEKLLNLISSSADEGYHRGHKNYMTAIDNVVTTFQVREVDSMSSIDKIRRKYEKKV